MKTCCKHSVILTALLLSMPSVNAEDTQSTTTSSLHTAASLGLDLKQLERDRILKAAQDFLHDEPITVTAAVCPRSSGGAHDFYSEGDYWWPNPNDPAGPYIQRDGMTNPENFVEHRHAMIRLQHSRRHAHLVLTS